MSVAWSEQDFAPVSTRARSLTMPRAGRATHSQAPMIMFGPDWPVTIMTLSAQPKSGEGRRTTVRCQARGWISLGSGQIVQHRLEKAGRLASGAGAVIEGQRQRNHAMDLDPAEHGDHFVPQRTGRHDGNTGRGDDRRGIASGKFAEVRQDDRVILQILRRNRPIAGIFAKAVDLASKLPAIGLVDITQGSDEQAVSSVYGHSDVHVLVDHPHAVLTVVPGVQPRFGLSSGP